MSMDLHDEIKAQLMKHEGLRLKPYQCTAGKWTIGVGRNIEDRGITEAEAMHLLDNDIDECQEELDRITPWWIEKPAHVQLVLINMMFNLGATRLLGFKKFLKAVEENNFDLASTEMLDSRWAKQVGQRSIELSEFMKNGYTE